MLDDVRRCSVCIDLAVRSSPGLLSRRRGRDVGGGGDGGSSSGIFGLRTMALGALGG